MTVEDIKNIIDSEEIMSIDIRYVDNLGRWSGVSFVAKSFDYDILSQSIQLNEFRLNPVDLTRCFIDPFLAHKTLVFLTDILETEDIIALQEKETNEMYQISFYFDNTVIEHGKTTSKGSFSMAPYDEGRDIRTEICLALSEMGVDIVFHHHGDESNKHVILLRNNDNALSMVDDIQKIKYCCLMVSKAYKLEINTDKGIFIDYLNPYKAFL